jgi:hypothetical protein
LVVLSARVHVPNFDGWRIQVKHTARGAPRVWLRLGTS